jgi:hypothetical protein
LRIEVEGFDADMAEQIGASAVNQDDDLGLAVQEWKAA